MSPKPARSARFQFVSPPLPRPALCQMQWWKDSSRKWSAADCTKLGELGLMVDSVRVLVIQPELHPEMGQEVLIEALAHFTACLGFSRCFCFRRVLLSLRHIRADRDAALERTAKLQPPSCNFFYSGCIDIYIHVLITDVL